jgi:hypothetical protein
MKRLSKYLVLVVVLFVLAKFLAGCESCRIPPVNENHPAHPNAAAAPDIEQAGLLEVDKANLPGIPPEMKESQVNTEH